jgi:hypothetical protein
MRVSRGFLLLAALSLLSRPAHADTRLDRLASTAADLVDHLRGLLRGSRGPAQLASKPAPSAIPDGPDVDLGDLSRPTAIEDQLRPLLKPGLTKLRLTVPGGTARKGDYSLGSSESLSGNLLVVAGNADLSGRVNGNVVSVRGDVVIHPGAVITGDVLTIGGQVKDQGGEIDGEVRTLASTSLLATTTATAPPALTPLQSILERGAGVLGVFLTLGLLGFGLVLFGRPNLEIVSDTVSHSFGRAFVTGLLGQILLLPTFGMLVVGLILSVAGILLLPFAVAVFALLAVVAIVGGYLAVAHAMGETYVRRRMASGAVIGSPNSYRYLLVGLGALGCLWLAWAFFGWVPVAGNLIWGAAFFVSWLLGSAGFGAALLSRAGIKENFAGRLIPPEALTDEYLWATPQYGVPAGRRPGSRPPIRGS